MAGKTLFLASSLGGRYKDTRAFRLKELRPKGKNRGDGGEERVWQRELTFVCHLLEFTSGGRGDK